MPGGNLAVQMTSSTHSSNGGRMVTADGRTLPLIGASLTADAKAGIVRVTLQQQFVNPYEEPLTVTYQMPLPADAAVSGFSFVIGDRRVVGEVDTKKKARERFDEAVLEGRTAALLDQERSALFTQSVGNIPPRAAVVSELVLDQKLAFLPDGYWEWRFPTVVAPRYQGEEGRVPDAARVTVDVADAAMPVKLHLNLSVRDRLPDGARPESPSHALHTVKGVQRFDVGFGDDAGSSLDRDVVVRWKAGELQPGVELDTGRPIDGGAAGSAYGLVTLVPPSRDARMKSVPRDLILLLDTSGSMDGTPISQMKRVAQALIDSLDENDSLEMIEFSSATQRWRGRQAIATAQMRKEAQSWVAKLTARGGTEMRSGILEALAPLRREAQRQVVLMTDGLIGFESEIVQTICERLPGGSRVHTVGIGSGVNRSLTAPAARAGRGLEVIIGLDEDPERGAQRILARTAQPLVTRVEISGSAVDGVAPAKPCDLYAGAPALASVRLKPHGGEIVVRGVTASGEFVERLEVKPIERGEGSAAIAKLYARESVEDLEVALAAGGDKRAIDQRITSLGLDFQISTRLTSWIAVSPEATVDPRAPKRAANVPQELAYGMSAEGLGLRQASVPKGAHSGSYHVIRSAPPLGAPAPAAPPALLRSKRAAPVHEAEEKIAEEMELGRSLEEPAADFSGEAPADEEPAAEEPAPPVRREVAERRRASGFAPAQRAKRDQDEKKEEGFFEKAKKALFPGAPKKPAGPRKLKGRIVLRKDGRLGVELSVDGLPLEWNPGQVIVHLKGGAVSGATVMPALTTSSGTMEAGMKLTLMLELPALASEPESLTVMNGGEALTVELDG